MESEQTFYKTLPKIHIGKLPIMLKSAVCVLQQYSHVSPAVTGECEFDAGGYFIINGSEKTCLAQERAAENLVQCFNTAKNNNKWEWTAEIKSVPDFKCISPKQITMMVASKNNGLGQPIFLQIPRIKQPIPLFAVFRALGVENDKDICDKIILNVGDRTEMEETQKLLMLLRASVLEGSRYMTKKMHYRLLLHMCIRPSTWIKKLVLVRSASSRLTY